VTRYREVDGVAWCVEHEGIVDECSDHLDDEGEPCCDMADVSIDNKCRIVPLYVAEASSTPTPTDTPCAQCGGIGTIEDWGAEPDECFAWPPDIPCPTCAPSTPEDPTPTPTEPT